VVTGGTSAAPARLALYDVTAAWAIGHTAAAASKPKTSTVLRMISSPDCGLAEPQVLSAPRARIYKSHRLPKGKHANGYRMKPPRAKPLRNTKP